jgi:hypothetical protein
MNRGACPLVMIAAFILEAWLPSAVAQRTIATSNPGAVANAAADRTAVYRMHIDLDTDASRVAVRQLVRWTNPGPKATDRMLFHVVPNHRPNAKQLEVYERTVESLRLNPRTSIDRVGRRFHLTSLTLDGRDLETSIDAVADTHLHVALGRTVQPSESIEVQLDYWIDLPPLQGRVGQFRGVTNLLNWYPVLAVFGEKGWDATPFVGWHQPWHVEVGHYDVTLTLPVGQRVASGGRVVSRTQDQHGRQGLKIQGRSLRDFTIVASDRFEVYESAFDGIPIRVLAFPEDQGNARLALQIATESIRRFSQWFGRYPYREFELVESYFGWNGNESSGLVMIDQRILDAPRRAGRYVEHLVTHEICHQWWYSAVGTDGFREPFMDESIVTWLTRVAIEDKYGANAEVLSLPGSGICQLPNIPYRTLVHSGFDLYRDRGGTTPTDTPLDALGHVHNLFFLVYDRGARVVGMIQNRLGRERFLAFLRHIYQRYRFRIVHLSDFQRELEDFTGESWDEFFDGWLRTSGVTDWAITSVKTHQHANEHHTTVLIDQHGEIAEPVDVQLRTADGKLQRLRLNPQQVFAGSSASWIERDESQQWRLTFTSDAKPKQVEIDPDGSVLDGYPFNNRWKQEPSIRFSPLFTPIDEAPIVHPIDRPSIVFGPNIDMESRIGLRAALIRGNDYRISPFLAYTFEPNYEHFSAGVDAIFYNVPAPNWQIGARYEHALFTNLDNDPGSQTRLYLRKVLAYTTSLVYPNLSYFDFYFRGGDNFFPDEDTTTPTDPRVEDYRDVRAFGVSFHADTRLPYWNPDTGWLFDAEYEHGFREFGDGQAYDRIQGQGSIVQRLPDGLGWLSETKLAGQLGAGYGFPNNGEHFRFGGPGRFRGLHSNRLEGNAFWIASAEWRYPILQDLDYEVADNFAALRSVFGAVFYDCGESYLFDRSTGFEQALGTGLYFEVPLLSFVENLTFRLEYGRCLDRGSDAFWFGLYRAF